MSSKTTILSCDNIFLGDGRILKNASVAVEGKLIREVFEGVRRKPKNAEIISFPGATLLPGLIDCHTHIALDGSKDPFGNSLRDSLAVKILKAAKHAEKTLFSGVTTIRDMGGADGVDLEIRNAINSGLVKGPRILAAGRVICTTGGHGWPIGRESDGPAEVVKAVREQIKAGADLIKFMVTGGAMTPGTSPGAMQMTAEEMTAGIREAHRAGKKTAAHAKGNEGIIAALKAGIDSIEHGTVLTPEAVSLMLKRNVPVIFTLSALYNMERVGVKGGVPADIMEKALLYKPRRQQSIAMAREAGVIAALGTDAGTPFNPHGENPRELLRMTEAGYSPVQALTAATGIAALTLGLENQLGTIEQGKLADLIIVRGNPMDNINLVNDSQSVKLIMKDGIVFK
jgi:imidazolonepropionase-like amidohydrolase